MDAKVTEEAEILNEVSPGLDGGYIISALVWRKEDDHRIPIKANTVMNALNRLDDDQMIKVRGGVENDVHILEFQW